MNQNDSNRITLIDEAPRTSPQVGTISTSIRRIAIIFGILIVLIALGILNGIHSRIRAEAALHTAAKESAVPAVEVVYPKADTNTPEIALPGITQAFTDAPIYARTNGYLKHWYFDIGAHVKKDQLLAEIDTSEIDQQLQQARAEPQACQKLPATRPR